MEKLVSIIIPAFNAEATIIETLDSVIKQTYIDIEIIVVDDGSLDNTIKVVRDCILQGYQISLYSIVNQGPAAARNYGFLKSNGDYLIFLDADDLLDKTYVSCCLEMFNKDCELSVVYTQTMFFERMDGMYNLPPFSFEQLLIENCLTATAMIKSSYFKDVGMYDESMRICEDWELWLRLISKYPKIYEIKYPLFFYRRRHSQDSITDHNIVNDIAEDAMRYIFHKHYYLYKKYNFGIANLFGAKAEALKYKRKYKNVWYRKFFYKLKQINKRKV